MAGDGEDLTEKEKYLKTNGPSTMAEMPGSSDVKTSARQRQMRKFRPRVGPKSAEEPVTSRRAFTVWYLEDEHDPADVLDKWLEVNEGLVGRVSPRAALMAVNAVGPEFKAVSKERLREFYGEAKWGDEWNTGGGEQPGESMADRLLDLDVDDVLPGNGDDEE